MTGCKKAWMEGDIGISSRPVERDESPISLDPPLPSSFWMMEQFDQHEFAPFQISDVYVRDSFVPLARSIIAFYGGDHASSTTTGIFTNPFMGFKAGYRKVAIVSGTSDNGKTVFLYFLLRCRLQAKLPTILQLSSQRFFLFSSFGVHEFQESSLARGRGASALTTIAPDMWCLVDSNHFNLKPSAFLRYSELSIIQTTSPNRSSIRWADKSYLDSHEFFMPPFTLEEAIIVRSLRSKPVPSESQLHYWFNTYAPSARLAFLNAHNPRSYERTHLSMLLSRIYDPTSLDALASGVMSFREDDLSHELFVFFPTDNYNKFTCCIPTQHLCNKLIERSGGLQDDKQRRHYFHTLSRLRISAPAGFLIEEE